MAGRQQRLLWLDIPHGRVHRFDPVTGSDEVSAVGKPVGAVGLRTGGGLVLAVEDGFALLDPDREHVEQVAVVEHPVGARKTDSGLPWIKLAFEGSSAVRQVPSGRSK